MFVFRLIEMPLSGLMTVGYDVCHDPKNKNDSWGAMVATMDLKKRNNEFFSTVDRHKSGEEISNKLGMNICKAVKQFMQINNVLPERILFFRDGIGDGQIRYAVEQELDVMKRALKEIYQKHGKNEVPFLYMIVTKRVNTRIFFNRRNPDPGTCVDNIITLPERYVHQPNVYVYFNSFVWQFFPLFSALVMTFIWYLKRFAKERFRQLDSTSSMTPWAFHLTKFRS